MSFKSVANGDCERFAALAAVSSQELEQIGTLLFQLVHRALRGRLVRTPAQEAGAVPKTILGGVIVANLHDRVGSRLQLLQRIVRRRRLSLR